MKAFRTMLLTELKLSIRDMNMIIFAIIMPIVIMIILGIIYGGKAAYDGASYTFLEQSFGALCSISICAGGLMGLPIMISEYRERKILKRFKVTPVSAVMLLLVHMVIYSLYSLISAVSLYIIGKLIWNISIKGSIIIFIFGWLLVLFSILSVGLLAGGLAKNAKSASVIASILYFPMLVFSGATLPYEIMPKTMQRIVDIMPLTQGIKILKATMLGEDIKNALVPIVIMIVLGIICTGLAIRFFKWE